jgi:hypothetical protein
VQEHHVRGRWNGRGGGRRRRGRGHDDRRRRSGRQRGRGPGARREGRSPVRDRQLSLHGGQATDPHPRARGPDQRPHQSPCLDANGNYVAQPGPLADCPEGSARQYKPVADIHIGIVSSSLGGHGSDACATNVAGKESNNDRGRLIARKDPATPEQVETYQNLKFLAWDPAQQLSPPGEADVDADTGSDANGTALVPTLREMVLGVGQIGCGYESQLESWYRFLVDPSPPETVTLDADKKVLLEGVDEVLLDQRRAFLRPDSLLAIVMLTDENDCSIKEQGQFYYAAQQKGANNGPFHLPRARSVCDADPNDTCCFSCGQKGPVDNDGNPVCPADPACKTADGKDVYHDDLTDNINLRCWNQKRRFGIDFLYPVTRYVDALRSQTVVDRTGQVVANPLFSDLDPSDSVSQIRSSDRIMLAGIVGVPWQDIAKNPQDLKQGFKTTSELTQPNVNGQTTWDIILGDPARDVKPLDPFMHESIFARTGQNPITGESTNLYPFVNDINGNEFTNSKQDDLQYACVMPIPEPRDCSVVGGLSCDCEDVENDNPVCDEDPLTGEPTLQIKAKAYPGLRHLAVLQGLGDQAVIGSICAQQITDPTLPDYAYRPAVSSLLDRMKSRLE